MKNKVATYMGFAAKARKIVTGYNTCIYMMGKKKGEAACYSRRSFGKFSEKNYFGS